MERPESDDPICSAWIKCAYASTMTSIACERLGDLPRTKAGISDPGPTAAYLADSRKKLGNETPGQV